ncbi:hypothetical protein FGADI_1513 [Fusarium gaditjirri]|uniref:Uncharacterized protein n=1 Tax=Fusarium gaditjirri TaxID=282569 RepID=A0A8H4TL47_9HYPO|nr:hypothetical protein FGADI_1513 [Fusarium gaditjirri]
MFSMIVAILWSGMLVVYGESGSAVLDEKLLVPTQVIESGFGLVELGHGVLEFRPSCLELSRNIEVDEELDDAILNNMFNAAEVNMVGDDPNDATYDPNAEEVDSDDEDDKNVPDQPMDMGEPQHKRYKRSDPTFAKK